MSENVQTPAIIAAIQDDSDIAARLREFVQDRDAFSSNTWSQLMSVMAVCWRWSREHQRSFLPMHSADLRDYLSWLQATGRASTTISAHASLIAMLHRNAGVMPPNTSPLIYRVMKKINRQAVLAGERTGQAVPFCLADLKRIDGCWAGSPRLQDLRNLAFLHVAYSTLLRISELARIRVGDVSRAADGRIIIDVSHTKTIVQTGGLTKALSNFSSRRLTEWIDAAGLGNQPDAYLFCRVHRSNRPLLPANRPLSRPAVEDIFTRAWQATGEASPQRPNKNRYRAWSGHSARVGAAQDMTRKGYPVARIMQEGTWKKPETLMRYVRNVDAHTGAMVDLMEDASPPHDEG
ncbi:tyrosine-type recombinase/integrase [Erwinia sp.]|uniref:tyrosine-type recombinase/integrase n=1 Tax=Erwinia citreus TaxID=558 RepID=UPI003C75BECD